MSSAATTTQPDGRREGEATAMRRPATARALARAQLVLAEQVLHQLERRCGLGESLLQANGKAAFRRRLETTPLPLAERAADRLLAAIEGYVFHAYCSGRRRVGPALMREFRERAEGALTAGLAESCALIGAIGAGGPRVERALVRTAELVRGRLAGWAAGRQRAGQGPAR